MDSRTPVVVLYRGNQGALGIARSLGRLGVSVHLVTQEGEPTPLAASRDWAEKLRWDFGRPEGDTLEYLAGLSRRLRSRHGARPVLLTATDWAAVFIESNAVDLSDHYVFPLAPTPVVRRLADKWSMTTAALETGVPTPATIFPQTGEEALSFAAEHGYPLAFKAADPYGAHVPAAKIVRSEQELLEKLDAELALGAPNMILQEYVPGDVTNVWMCNAYFDREGVCRAIFTGPKLRQLSSTGIATLAVCLPNETVAEQVRRLMEGVGYRGCTGIGQRYDPRDGRYKLLDVNARVSGVFRLFRATSGLDVVRVCYLDLTGQPIGESRPTVGRKWLLEDDFFVALPAIARRELGVREWLSSLRGVREAQWFSWRDPLPVLVWLRGSLGRSVSRRLRRRRS